MTLTQEDRDNPLWLKLKAEYEARLAQLRASNDTDKDEIATAKLRGQISEIKRFLDMGAIKAKIEVE